MTYNAAYDAMTHLPTKREAIAELRKMGASLSVGGLGGKYVFAAIPVGNCPERIARALEVNYRYREIFDKGETVRFPRPDFIGEEGK